MWIMLLKQYWWEIALSLIVFAFLGYIGVLDSRYKDLELKEQGVENALNIQSAIIESNRVDYERNLADANKTNTIIQTRYKDRVKVIYEWSEQNATCTDAMQYINHYSY